MCWRRRTSRSPRPCPHRPSAAGFIDLGSLAGPARDSCGALELCLDLGGGMLLQILRR